MIGLRRRHADGGRPPLIDEDELLRVAARYATFSAPRLGYGTVRDYCDSFDHLRPLATANGDLKDLQRPWALKAVVGALGGRAGRILEIGAGEPLVADLLARLGHEVWVVDPYDGSGNGPVEYERFRDEFPRVRFLREQFGTRARGLKRGSFDCIYSISVLEHVPADKMPDVTAGMRRFLRPDGLAIHAVDHVHRGRGDASHLANLRLMTAGWGLSSANLDATLEAATADVDTYYLSAESHNRWRGGLSYDEFPMRVCISVQTCSPARDLQGGV